MAFGYGLGAMDVERWRVALQCFLQVGTQAAGRGYGTNSSRKRRRRISRNRYERRDRSAFFHCLPLRTKQLLDLRITRGAQLMLHLHRFDDDQQVARAYDVAGRYQPLDDAGLQRGSEFSHARILGQGRACGSQPGDGNVRALGADGNFKQNKLMPLAPLIATTCGQTLENQHFGAIAVVNAQGRLLASTGDPTG